MRPQNQEEAGMNLIRVEIDFDHSTDDIFRIDLKKSGIVLPFKTRKEIVRKLVDFRREARIRYHSGRG